MKSTIVVCGLHAVEEVINAAGTVSRIYCNQNQHSARRRALCEQATASGIDVVYVGKERLDRLAEGIRHQGMVAVCRPDGSANVEAGDLFEHLDNLTEVPLLLVIDGIQDPRNLGACLRAAAAFGAHAVVIPKRRGAGITPTVTRVAAGGVSRVPLFEVSNWPRTLISLKSRGVWLIGADENSKTDVTEVLLDMPLALVVGGEERGVRPGTRKHCDEMVRVPTQTDFASLNVAVAVGVLFYETIRQRISGLPRRG